MLIAIRLFQAAKTSRNNAFGSYTTACSVFKATPSNTSHAADTYFPFPTQPQPLSNRTYLSVLRPEAGTETTAKGALGAGLRPKVGMPCRAAQLGRPPPAHGGQATHAVLLHVRLNEKPSIYKFTCCRNNSDTRQPGKKQMGALSTTHTQAAACCTACGDAWRVLGAEDTEGAMDTP